VPGNGPSESLIGLFLHEILRRRPQIVDELTVDLFAFAGISLPKHGLGGLLPKGAIPAPPGGALQRVQRTFWLLLFRHRNVNRITDL
jgi:hypothetical protein